MNLPVTEAPPSALAPQAPPAAHIANLWWIMLALGTVVWLLVMALLAWGLWRRRDPLLAEAPARGEPERALPGGQNAWLLGGGVLLPAVVLVTLLVLMLGVMRAIASVTPSSEIVVELTGRQFWWEVRYPNHSIVTANEIRIPVGVPVQVRLTSADVIHSFWAPQLHGKIDLMPGRTNVWALQADRVGEYRAECAEFCGVQHAKMHLIVVAETAEDFAAWTEAQQQPAPEPANPETLAGQQVFLGSACINCHTVRGTPANGLTGPDLTHLASRRSLGAGILPNTRGHLGGWIADPQALKPGNLMPASDLSSEELNLLLVYLESLR